MSWHTGRMGPFDLETTSADPETARIVTACVAQVGADAPAQIANWVADPGIEIPAEAAKIHGYDTARARTEGRPAAEVITEVTAALRQLLAHGVPIVAMNARYDLTVLDRECRRHGIEPLDEPCPVIDPFVIDKKIDRFRRGPRTLTALCQHYRVPLDGAHDSAADALAAARVAWRIAQKEPQIADADLTFLHGKQAEWAYDQAASLADYFRRTPGKEHQAASVRTEWPLIPAQGVSGP